MSRATYPRGPPVDDVGTSPGPHQEDTVKKIVALLALIGAAAAAASVFAKRRGQDLGEFAGEWSDRAKEVAASATETAGDSASSAADVIKDQAGSLKDT